MTNSTLDKIFKEICKEENILIESFCDSYCLRLSKNGKSSFIYDNVMENNPSSLYKILKDKAAVFEILSKHGVPCVEHFYMFSNNGINNSLSNTLNEQLKRYKRLVIKHNEGMSGKYVFYIDNSDDLITKSRTILNKFNSLSVSPFYNFSHEYRVVVLNEEVKLVFDKVRPFIIGDGKNTIQNLAAIKYGKDIKLSKNVNPHLIAKTSEKVTLSWKHNLNFGASPEIITDKKILSKLSKIALDASKILNIKFACIDIAEIDNSELKILEINGAVSMGKFASISEKNYLLAKAIYKQAILENFK